jgi:dihydroorotase
MSIVIKNGRRLVFTGDKVGDAAWEKFDSIVIESGLIKSVNDTEQNYPGAQLIDADGAYVLPGLVDLSVALPEPGNSHKGSIVSETMAAAAGGVTTLCCSPETSPINESAAVSKLIHELASEKRLCRVLPLGALTQGLKGEQLAAYASLKQAQCVALSNAYYPLKNLEITKRCFEYAKTHDMSVFINPIEPALHKGVMHEGEVSTTIGLQGISSLAETVAVAQLIQLANATGVHLHLSQLSTAEAVEQVRQAKAANIKISADVAVQNLVYTDANIVNFNSVYHCLPPLREEQDRQALIEGVNSGVIDAITSAHRPHEAAAKQAPFEETETGMSSIEFLLPLAQRLASRDEMKLEVFIDAMTRGASSVLRRTEPALDAGAEADLCIFDETQVNNVSAGTIVSHGKNTPLIGENLAGQVKVTILGGKIVHGCR